MKKKEILEMVVSEKNEQFNEMTHSLGRVACSILESLNGFSVSYKSDESWSISLGPFVIVDEEILGTYTHQELDVAPSVEKFSVDFIGALIAVEFNMGVEEIYVAELSPRID
jgi:hypothetical protein